MKTKSLLFVVLIISVLSFGFSACATAPSQVPDACQRYAVGSVDFESCCKDPRAYEFMQQVERNQQVEAEVQQPIKESAIEPVSIVLTTDYLWCDQAIDGDNVGSMAMAAYGGSFPPYYLNGIALQIAFYSDEDVEVFVLQHLFYSPNNPDYQEAPTLSVGDWICLSLNGEKLKSYSPGE